MATTIATHSFNLEGPVGFARRAAALIPGLLLLVAVGWAGKFIEQFIAAYARENHLISALCGSLAGKPGVNSVDGGLIHCVENARGVLIELTARNTADMMWEVIMPRDCRCNRDFIPMLSGKFFEADRDAFNRGSELGSKSSDDARIDSTG